MKENKIIVKLHTEKLCEFDYGRYVVLATYMNGKFLKVFTVDVENKQVY